VLALAGLLLALATGFGAFGAHALRGQLAPERLQLYETAVRYHFFNGLGLLGVGLALGLRDSGALRWSAVLLATGILLFCGSLYALTFDSPRLVGVVTPVGGVTLIAGWLVFAAGALKH